MKLHYTRKQLIQILQKAYSGELAAALAYRHHWKSLKSQDASEFRQPTTYEAVD